MDMNEAVAKAISAERTIAGLTVRKLAEEASIPERSLMRILQAEREIKVNQVEQLARALKLYPHELIEHAETILERAARATPDLGNLIVGSFGENAGTEQDEALPENIEEAWAGQYAADPAGDDPEDHTP